MLFDVAAILAEIEKREAAQGIIPDPAIAAYMRAAATEVRRLHSLVACCASASGSRTVLSQL